MFKMKMSKWQDDDFFIDLLLQYRLTKLQSNWTLPRYLKPKVGAYGQTSTYQNDV